MINKISIIILFILLLNPLNAQDITQVAKNKAVKITGGIAASTSFYHMKGEEDSRDPYYWQVSANLNMNFWGVLSMPFSVNFAKKNVRYQQPSFHQFGLSPKYKSITLHLGYRSMIFSNYTLSGLTFLGVGVDYQPDKFWIKASAMYGRFFKAVSYTDSTTNTFEDPSYERWGGGFKVTAEKNNQEFTIIVFKASDKANSIPDPPLGSTLTPSENFITGFAAKNRLTQNLTIRTEYTISAYTSDIRNPTKKFDKYTYLNNLGALFSPKYSSTLGKAFEIQIDYQIDFITLGLAYKRIDGNFKSMGSTFIENDMEDILFNISKSLFKKKLNLSGSIGRQRNNLDNSKQTEDNRVISSANGSLLISKSLSFNATYSNFTSSTQPTLINFTDSVQFFQINKNTSFTLNYSKSTEKIRHGVSFMVAFQNGRSLNRSATEEIEIGNKMVNSNLSWNISFIPLASSLTTAFQISKFTNSLNSTISYGPNFSVSKTLMDNKLNMSFSYSYQTSLLPDKISNSNHIFRINTDFKFDKHQSLNIFGSNLFRNKTGPTQTYVNVREFQAGLSYQFTF